MVTASFQIFQWPEGGKKEGGKGKKALHLQGKKEKRTKEIAYVRRAPFAPAKLPGAGSRSG